MKGVSDNVISVPMVMMPHCKEPPKLSFCTGGNLVACHFFPIVESPSDFLLSFAKKRSLKNMNFASD